MVNFVLAHVANKDHATLEVETTGQIFILHIRIPRDNTLAVGVQSTLKDVQSHRILQDSVAVIKHDGAFVVFKQRTVQTFGGRITLNEHEALTSIQDRARFKLSQIRDVLQTIGFQSFGHRVGLTETTFTRNHGRGLDASGNHRYQLFHERKALIDPVFLVLCVDGFGCLGDRAGHFRETCLYRFLILGADNDFAIYGADKLTRSRVKRDQSFHRAFHSIIIIHHSISIPDIRIKGKVYLILFD